MITERVLARDVVSQMKARQEWKVLNDKKVEDKFVNDNYDNDHRTEDNEMNRGSAVVNVQWEDEIG